MRRIVNGIEQDVTSPPLTPLLHVLRDELDWPIELSRSASAAFNRGISSLLARKPSP